MSEVGDDEPGAPGDPSIERLDRMVRLYAELAEATADDDGSIDPTKFDAHCRAEIEKRHSDLVTSLRQSDAFAAVAHVGYANLTNDPNTFAESTHEGLLAIVEYVAGVFLSGPQRMPSGNPRPATGRLVAEWNQSVKDLLHIEHARLSVNRGDHVLADARRAQVTRNLLVRGAAFRWQEQSLCRHLFGSSTITADLEAVVGFSVDDALRMTEWLIRRPVEKMTTTMAALRTLVDRVVETVNGTAEAPEIPAAMIEQLRKLPEDQREDAAAAFMLDKVFATIGPRLSFTPDDLAAGTGSTIEAARQFLDLFSLSFGDLTGMDGFRCMQEARARPVIYDEETSTYTCVLVDDLVWALRPRLQAELKKAGKAVWNRFESARSRLSEARAEELIAAAVAPDQIWDNLRWRAGDQIFELDRLMFVDDVALVVEVKAGELTPAARRGAPDTLGRDVRKLVTDADEQAERVRALLETGEHLTFETTDGRPVVIDTSAVQRAHTIVVVLDDLSALTPRMWALTEQGLLPEGHPAPLVVSVHELEILADLLDRPSVLVHYLRRRERFNLAQSLEAFEELDLVMDYITGGLIWDPPADEAESVRHLLASSTDDLDAYYLKREGKRSAEAAKPAVDLPPQLDSLIRAFETERPPGWLQASISLLELSGEGRQKTEAALQEVFARHSADGRPHDFSFGLPPLGTGFTIIITATELVEQSLEAVQVLAVRNKHRRRADSWFAVVAVPDGALLKLAAFAYLDHPWEPDPALDAVLGASGGRDVGSGTAAEDGDC